MPKNQVDQRQPAALVMHHLGGNKRTTRGILAPDPGLKHS